MRPCRSPYAVDAGDRADVEVDGAACAEAAVEEVDLSTTVEVPDSVDALSAENVEVDSDFGWQPMSHGIPLRSVVCNS